MREATLAQPLAVAARTPDSPARIRDAAQQFEALLIAQLLRSMRPDGGGFGDASARNDALFEVAEQEFAKVLASRGGLGLARLIAEGLAPRPQGAPPGREILEEGQQ
jgi:Rod binding domain-containing protein